MTIFITVYDGDIEKNILQSSVLRTLREREVKIVLLVKHGLGESYAHYASNDIVVEELPDATCFSEKFFYWLGWNILPTKSIYLRRYRSYDIHHNWLRLKLGELLGFFGRSRLFKATLRRIYRAIPDTYGESLFERYKPDLLFAPSMFSFEDGRLLRTAARRGVKTVTTSKSWDVLTNKAFTRVLADIILVQNEIIKESAIRLGDYPPERVRIVGFVQFDFVVDNSLILPRDEFCRHIGADPKKKIILYSTSGDWKNPYDDEVVARIHEALMTGEIPEDAQIVARFHPKYSSKVEALDLPRLIKYRPCAGVEQVESFDSSASRVYPFTFGHEDFVYLANMLYHSDVTINTMSSITLDAIAFDKPVVLVGHDGLDRKFPYLESLRRMYDEDHFRSVMDIPCARACYTMAETLQATAAYLDNPQLDAQGRARVRSEVLYKLDGHSGKRIAEAVLAHLDA